MTNKHPESLIDKAASWLSGEGYNTEFRAASCFKNAGLRIFRGQYVRDATNKPREIDVIARKDDILKRQGNDRWLFRVEFIVECKWSKEKPWIIFADEFCQIAPQACIAHSFVSSQTQHILSTLAQSKNIQNLQLFATPEKPGFAGRQAFDKGNNRDLFYTTMKSVTSAAYDETSRYKTTMYSENRQFVFAFPIIVIDGAVLKATYNEYEQRIHVEESDYVRCHWRGADNWQLHATVDIIQLSALDEYLQIRKSEISNLLEHAKRVAAETISSDY